MKRSDHYSVGDKPGLTTYFISVSAPRSRRLRGCESSAAVSLPRIQATDLEVKISLSHYTPPETARPPLPCFLCSLSFILISRFNLLSMSRVPVKDMLSTRSSKDVNTVCSSPRLGISGAFWLFVKHFCFSNVYLSEFHIITLAGQTLNRSGERCSEGLGQERAGLWKWLSKFFARKRWLGADDDHWIGLHIKAEK